MSAFNKIFLICLCFILTSVAKAAMAEMNKVSLSCSGDILKSTSGLNTEILAQVKDLKIDVINPWYGEYSDRTSKGPQVIIAAEGILGSVKKSVNSPKEIVLEVYQVESSAPKNRIDVFREIIIGQSYARMNYSSAEATSSGLGSSLYAEVGNHAISIHCIEVQP